MRNFVRKNTIFLTLAGSRMYGTSTPESDTDIRGVCVPPKNVVLGFANKFEQQMIPDEEDSIIYGLKKFMALAAECNPNILELLFAPESAIITSTPTWEALIEHREMFITAAAYPKFSGYALSQLKRIRSHRAWLLSPPAKKPTREEYGLTDQPSSGLTLGTDMLEPETLKRIKSERQFKTALRAWNQYQGWKKDRNPKRAVLEASFGYDTKHAMHLVRLLRMGEEILTQGKVIVERPDAEELLDIRRGKWTYDQLMENVEPMKNRLDKIFETKSYSIPDRADINALSDLCAELHERFWHEKETK
tara:strand:- start:13508 stop:14422 length:915 start_codon:yes stop_codon:yes gene_type:complete